MARKSIEVPGVTSREQAERLARQQAYRPLVIKRPEPDLEVRTYLVRRRERCDDVLEGLCPGDYDLVPGFQKGEGWPW